VSQTEWLYLQKDGLLPLDLQQLVTAATPLVNRAVRLRIPLERVEEIRDALTLNLAQRGFGEGYVPNEEGRMLEDLLDRFLVV
jgi:hypothetical protein